MSFYIDFVEAVGNDFGEVDAALIAHVLQNPEKMVHSGAFTGRPATQLFVDENYVVKIRSDFVFQNQDAARRAEAAAKQDRLFGVCHPNKCWFVVKDDDSVMIGNIAPRLQPLH